MNKQRDEILGILLPDQDYSFLLPNVSIAEIFTLESNLITTSDVHSSNTVKSTIQWRGKDIILFHLNYFSAEHYQVQDIFNFTKARIAVINSITKPAQPSYAILATDTPKLTRLTSQGLHDCEETSYDAIAYKGRLGQDIVHIPDLMYLETLAARYLNA